VQEVKEVMGAAVNPWLKLILISRPKLSQASSASQQQHARPHVAAPPSCEGKSSF